MILPPAYWHEYFCAELIMEYWLLCSVILLRWWSCFRGRILKKLYVKNYVGLDKISWLRKDNIIQFLSHTCMVGLFFFFSFILISILVGSKILYFRGYAAVLSARIHVTESLFYLTCKYSSSHLTETRSIFFLNGSVHTYTGYSCN